VRFIVKKPRKLPLFDSWITPLATPSLTMNILPRVFTTTFEGLKDVLPKAGSSGRVKASNSSPSLEKRKTACAAASAT
jgi:hypothetical protein